MANRRARRAQRRHRAPAGSVDEEFFAQLLGERCTACENGVGAHCHGLWIEHADGTEQCEDGCDGSALHVRGASCQMFGPCERCG